MKSLSASTATLVSGSIATSAARRGARRSRWRRVRALFLPAGLALLASIGCTLTSDEFEPVRIEPQPNQPEPNSPEPSSPAVPVGCAGGVECCAELPCASGQACSGGRCQPSLSAPDAGPCQSEDCQLPEQLEPPPVTPELDCGDGALGPGETDTDCGDRCGSTCALGQRCRSDADCSPGLTCPGTSLRCAPPSCADGILNGDELEPDCGGGTCPGCDGGSSCSTNADCQSLVCGGDGRCAAPSCDDGVRNGSETAEDCGGQCAPCGTGSACNEASDCSNGVCRANNCPPGVALCCQPRSCTDGVRNGTESDVDCGGPCANCATGGRCNAANDCQSAVCAPDGCAPGVQQCCQAPSCNDGVANGGEPVPDCGNAACGLCALGDVCTANAQCQSGFCQAGRCTDPGTCNDGILNGTESAIDCGGDRCPRCADRLPCTQAADCINNNCFNGVCISCGSGVIDGTETDIDCGGSDPACQRCPPGRRCLVGSDCQGGQCFGGFC